MLLVDEPPVCPETATLKFDIASVAGFYSQLTGVLAGLAFAALIFLASARLERDSGTAAAKAAAEALHAAYRMLISSFLCLTVASLGYAVLGGSLATSGRAVTEQIVLAVSFSLAAAMMFYAIALTLDATSPADNGETTTHRESISRYVRDVLVVVVSPLAVVYTALGLGDYSDVRYGVAAETSFLEIIGIVAIIVQLAVSWIGYPVYCAFARRRAADPSGSARSTESNKLLRSVTRITWFFMGCVFASVATFGAIDSTVSEDLCTTTHPSVPLVAFLVTTTSILLLTVHVARFRNRPLYLAKKTESP